MAKPPVNLTAHKSQIVRRRRRKIRREVQDHVKAMLDGNNVAAYAVVMLTEEGEALAAWDTGGVLPMWAMPQTVATILHDDMAGSGVAEDYRRPVIDSAWKGAK